ncbi:MAG: PBP1A family penicillin-binding protein [Thermoleophilia bacterium]
MPNDTRRNARRGRSRAARFFRLLFLLLLLGIISLISAGSGLYVGLASDLPSLAAQGEYEAAQTTKVFDGGDPPQLLAELHGIENREMVTGESIPQFVRDAVVATEDQRFYSHSGVDIFGIARALWADIRAGSYVQGASTITQQYIKNAYITNEKTVNRKVKEAALAYQLEKQWSKEKILNEYLNIIYFGEGAYGIQAAAHTYFGVNASDLTAAQAALLVGVPKSPSNYSPRQNPEAALGRRDLILNMMYQQGYLTSEELQTALAEDVKLAPSREEQSAKVPYWVELVRGQLVAKYGSSTVLQGGLRVYTSIDLRMQEAAERAVADILNEPGDPSAALVSIDLRTGGIVAMVGGADFGARQFNLATQSHRQPGSAFKTFVLATALEQGVTPATVYDSGPITVELPGDDWNVKSKDVGPITLTEATAASSNGAFARLIMDVGPENVVETAARLGIESPLDPNPAIALGGLTTGVSPLEMAVAYGSIAAGGERLSGSVVFDPDHPVWPIAVTRVERAGGELVDENTLVRTPVMDPASAYLTTDALKGVISHGTARTADIGRPAAGKTGTTQEYRDAWFVGYTPDLVTAVWVGYPDEQKEMTDVHGIKVTGGSFPAQIWAAFMREALADVEPHEFPEPAGSKWITVSIDPESGLLATEWCPQAVSTRFLAGTEPTEPCPLHQPEEVPVPDVVGLSLEEARAALETARFVVEVVEGSGAAYPLGLVFAQDPPGGTNLLQGSPVRVTVASDGAAAGTVPAVVGLDAAAARRSLTAAGYVISERTVVSEAPKGIVIDQTPAGGASAAAGSTIEIVVSASNAETTTTQGTAQVPNVMGLRLARALQLLERAGLTGEVTGNPTTDDPQSLGRVATQSPEAGATVGRGTSVSLSVFGPP